MILYIDTTEFGKVTFVLTNKKKIFTKSHKITPQESGKILEYLHAFLTANKITLPPPSPSRGGLGRGGIKKIVLYKKKTGSFTGLRIAATIAQALSLAWLVPVEIIVKN